MISRLWFEGRSGGSASAIAARMTLASADSVRAVGLATRMNRFWVPLPSRIFCGSGSVAP